MAEPVDELGKEAARNQAALNLLTQFTGMSQQDLRERLEKQDIGAYTVCNRALAAGRKAARNT